VHRRRARHRHNLGALLKRWRRSQDRALTVAAVPESVIPTKKK